MNIRIGTQNLGMDDMVRAASLVGDIVRHYELDIFCMQEVYRWPRDRKFDLMAMARDGVGDGYYYHEGPADTWMINVTLSRYPITHTVTVPIEDRHLLHTQIVTPEGRLTVYNWHAKRHDPCRYNRQAFSYMAWREPGYLVGDMNATIDDIMECGGDTILRRNTGDYTYSDFFAHRRLPQVLSVVAEGNVYELQDAHILTVATVQVGGAYTVFAPVVFA